MKQTRRGFVPQDRENFSDESLDVLGAACADLYFLLNRAYDDENALTFVGNHYQLLSRQREALKRAVLPRDKITGRGRRCRKGSLKGKRLAIDGFNIIITLEAALSEETTLIRCMDGVIRDLCGLHGSYSIIADTEEVLNWLGEYLSGKKIESVVFYLDKQVSNSGRLKEKILSVMAENGVAAEAELSLNPDSVLRGMEYVVSGDRIILEYCQSWVNLAADMIAEKLPGRRIVDFCGKTVQ
jgi:hypothetical protein